MDKYDLQKKRMEGYDTKDMQKLSEAIGWLNFPSHMLMRPMPPFGGSAWRMLITLKNSILHRENKYVSVYLDDIDALGCVGKPYWEIYPNEEGDTDRFLLSETYKLIPAIDRALYVMLRENTS